MPTSWPRETSADDVSLGSVEITPSSVQILVVDDDLEQAKYICESLESLGYQGASSVATGEEALRRIEDSEVDLVLMDIWLRGSLDGIETAHRIVTQADVPVIYLTAYADDQTIARAKRTAAAGYLVKPCKRRELKAMIETALSHHRKQRAIQKSHERSYQVLEDSLDHELGNWLGAAEFAAQLLISSPDLEPDRRARLAEVILDTIRSGKQAAHDVAALAGPVSERAEKSAPLELAIKQVVRLCQREGFQQDVLISIEGRIPGVRVPASPLRLALANVVSNAVKYHRKDASDRWVHVSSSLDDSQAVEIVVEDNGPGIPAADREHIFAYGFRGDRDSEGSGLGLTIAHEAIENAGGSISLDEGSEGGARFTLTVPVIEEDISPPATPDVTH